MNDHQRLHELVGDARLVRLWRAANRLRTITSFLNTGAHPDDETSGMLAALSLGMGIRTGFACANRGEGGQNAIGHERGADLGVIRSAEMARAARVLDMSLFWLSEHPDDTIFDFRFSKSADETLAKWGYERTLRRMVAIYRTFRPDMVCPTFLDVPGQHGHHRAMTRIAEEAVAAAADAKFYPDLGLSGWQVAKFYLPAWSGAGTSYDDDEPPPPATTIVDAHVPDPATGAWYPQLGQLSRSYHLTQNMGTWVEPGPQQWPLHLKLPGSSDESSILHGLPARFADLDSGLMQVDSALLAVREGFPDGEAMIARAVDAIAALQAAQVAPEHQHRVDRKVLELKHVVAEAALGARGALAEETVLKPGGRTRVRLPNGARLVGPEGWAVDGDTIEVPADAAATPPYPAGYDPLEANHAITVEIEPSPGVRLTCDLVEPIEIVPAHQVSVAPTSILLNRSAPSPTIPLTLSAGASLDLPTGWALRNNELQPPAQLVDGAQEIAVLADGVPASTLNRFEYPHTGIRHRAVPAVIRVQTVTAELPENCRVGYLGSGHDRVGEQLVAMGLDVSIIDDLVAVDLSAFTTLVVGIFAFGHRDDLDRERIHAWVRSGGHLLTLYHRPWDRWEPARTPLYPIEIGQPSLRWRVTDEACEVTHLVADHPLLNSPNPIGPPDWQGWVKERGLYFAKSWDPAYAALLSMADPNEAPLTGGLLSATVENGRHTHTSLALHTQLEEMVPGAVRLMANLVQPSA